MKMLVYISKGSLTSRIIIVSKMGTGRNEPGVRGERGLTAGMQQWTTRTWTLVLRTMYASPE